MLTKERLDEIALSVARNRYVEAHGGTGEGINFSNYADFSHALLKAVQGELEVAGVIDEEGIMFEKPEEFLSSDKKLTTLPIVEE